MQAAEHLSFGAYAWRLGLVVLLVLANAFFVAAEFALVSARRSRIDQMASEGDRGSVWGRPVDVLVAPDGALLVSDDDGGAIYRITYPAP